jgi:ParB family transcriptional regulator, chromosome partitioning protein
VADTTTLEHPTETPQAPEAPAVGDGPMLVHLDPRDVTAHPHNVRDAVDVSDLLPSVREVGVLQPPLVAPTGDGGWRIVAGHRRMAAAVEAGLDRVACLVREDLAGDPEAVIGMLVENLHRQDLTPMEEARGYQLLLDLGVAKTKIAKRTGRKPGHVKKALQIAGNPVATEAVEAGLTFEQALVIREFEDDPEAVEGLYDAAEQGEGAFRHHASYLRERRKEAQERAEAIEALAATGVTVIDPTDRDTWPNITALGSLVTDDAQGNDIDPGSHANCPGHAAALDHWDNEAVRYYCTDPAANGHRKRFAGGLPSTNGTGGGLTDEQKAERRLVRENNAAWRAAEPVRREYIRELLSRKRPPKGTLRFVVSEVMRRPEYVGDGKDDLLAELLGTDAAAGSWGRAVGPELVERATDARLPLVLLAQVAADREADMDVHTWRAHRPTDQARWLSWLASTGYTLSAIEQSVIDLVAPTDDETDSHGAGDQDPSDESTNHEGDDLAPVVVLPAADSEGNDDPAEPAPLRVVPDSDATSDDNGATDMADVTRLAAVTEATDDTAKPIDGPTEGDAPATSDTA